MLRPSTLFSCVLLCCQYLRTLIESWWNHRWMFGRKLFGRKLSWPNQCNYVASRHLSEGAFSQSDCVSSEVGIGHLSNEGRECGQWNSLLVFTVLSRARNSRTLRNMVHCDTEECVRNPSPTAQMFKDRPTCFHIESKQIMTRKRDVICMTTSAVYWFKGTTVHLTCIFILKHT